MAEEATYYQKDDTGGYVEASLPSFHDQLPEGLKDHETLKDMDPGKLAQAYVDLSANRPRAPESPDKYTVPEAPEGIPLDDEALTSFKAFAHENGMTDELFQKIVGIDFERAKKYVEADKQETENAAAEIKKAREEATKQLDTEWGVLKEKNMELVAKVKARFLDEDTIKKWDEAGLGDDPTFLRFLASIGGEMDEDRLILPNQRTSEIPRQADGSPILRYDHPTS